MLVILLIFCGVAFYVYNTLWGPGVNNTNEYQLYIPTGASYEDVKNHLEKESLLKSPFFFDLLADQMNYKKDEVKSGKYAILPETSLRDLLSKLRSGDQVPVNVTFNNIRKIEELAGKISTQIEADSVSLLNAFQAQENLDQKEVSKETVGTLFIPDTYQVYWNISPQQLFDRLSKEQKNFWNSSNRKEKAESIGLSPLECSILASIVQKESNSKTEQPIIAGVYLNRLRRGMPLQADPTVVFAVGDFTIKRVLNKHLLHQSPYNTYLNKGLPPGPICIPEATAIDAVLNAEDHKYLYFCAKPGYNGGHLFAKNLIDHNKNARTYQRWLSREGILR